MAVGAYGAILSSRGDILEGVLKSDIAKTTVSKTKFIITNNRISLILPSKFDPCRLKASIFTIDGKIIFHATAIAENGALTISTLGLPAGMYYLSIADNKKISLSVTFVLTR
jgi:hypothetical protein